MSPIEIRLKTKPITWLYLPEKLFEIFSRSLSSSDERVPVPKTNRHSTTALQNNNPGQLQQHEIL